MADMLTKTPSRILDESIANKGTPLFTMYELFWNHAKVQHLVIPFFILMHQIVRASVPLMESAMTQSGLFSAKDDLSRKIHDYMRKHIEEEKNHDLWILEDLESAGVDTSLVLEKAPSSKVAAMVGAQYYWIHHYHPVAMLGYIRLLEGNPPRTEHIERLKTVSGLPDSLFRTYRLHGELDPDHLGEFNEMLDSLPLTRDRLDLVVTSARFTADSLANILNGLITEVEQTVVS